MPLIATRVLEIRERTTTRPVPIRLHAPEWADETWICRFEIDWPDQRRKSFAGGYDAVQALDLALRRIGFELYNSTFHKAGTLVWHRAGDGYGFPVPVSARDLLVGSDRTFSL